MDAKISKTVIETLPMQIFNTQSSTTQPPKRRNTIMYLIFRFCSIVRQSPFQKLTKLCTVHASCYESHSPSGYAVNIILSVNSNLISVIHVLFTSSNDTNSSFLYHLHLEAYCEYLRSGTRLTWTVGRHRARYTRRCHFLLP